MTVLDKNKELLKLTAPVTGRTLKEDGTVVNLADLQAAAVALVDAVSGLPIGQGLTEDAAHVWVKGVDSLPGGIKTSIIDCWISFAMA